MTTPTILAFRGSLSSSGQTSWTVFGGLDLSAYSYAQVVVVGVNQPSVGDNTFSTSSSGWSAHTPSAKPKVGNLQSATVQAVETMFDNSAPTDSEEFIVTASAPASLAALLFLYA